MSAVEYIGYIKGDVVSATITATYLKTGSEATAADILFDSAGNAAAKKISVRVSDLTVKGTTSVDNYVLADGLSSYQTSAKILQRPLQSVTWTFDEKTNLPTAAFTVKDGLLASAQNGKTVFSIYAKSDSEYKTPLRTSQMRAGEIYVARVEGYTSNIYRMTDPFANRIYTFAYGKTELPDQTVVTNTLNQGLSLKWKKKKLTVKWGKVEGANGYYVYTKAAGKKYGKAVEVTDATSCTVAAKKTNKKYQAYVQAYRLVNGEKVAIGKSLTVGSGAGSKASLNAVKIKLSKKSVKVAVKKKKTLKATVTFKKNGKKIKKTGKAAKVKFWSTDKTIATVTSKGKIKGVKKGTCYVYVMAENGLKKKIKVTVG